MGNYLPVEYEQLLAQFASEPEPLRAIRRYGMIAMLVEDGKMKVETGLWNGQTLRLMIKARDAQRFKVTRPAISDKAEALLVAQTRRLVANAD